MKTNRKNRRNYMDKVQKLLETRKNYLLQLKKEKEEALIGAPNGFLRICCHGDRTQYYQRTDPKDFSGVYIQEKDIELAQKLAQKHYDKKVLASIEKELNATEKYLSSLQSQKPEQIYEKLHKERQKLITPIRKSDSEYVKEWEQVEYRGKEFENGAPEFYSAKGERVRSKSEMIIADLLGKEAIPYRYEYPIYLKGFGNVYPDFTVLNLKERKEIYWEHLGMMDDTNYVEKTLRKITAYEQNKIFPGENLILTYETKTNPINLKIVRLMIERYLK